MQPKNVQRVCKGFFLLSGQGLRFEFLFSSLLNQKHFFLPLLGSKFPLEAAIGMNGRVWVNAKETKHIIAIARCIEAVDSDGDGLDEAGVKKLLDALDL